MTGGKPPPGTPSRGRNVADVAPVLARDNDPKASDLSFQVGRGSQVIDIDLTPSKPR